MNVRYLIGVAAGFLMANARAMEEPKNIPNEMCTLTSESPQPQRCPPEFLMDVSLEYEFVEAQQRKYGPDFDSRRIDEEKRLALFPGQGKIVNRLSDNTDLPIVVKPSREMAKMRTNVVLLNLCKKFIDTLSSPIIKPLLPRNLGASITDCDLTQNNLYTLPLYLLVAELPNLENLVARNNKITYIETIDPYDARTFLTKNNLLKKVDVSYNRLEEIEPITRLLACYDGLRHLNLEGNPLSIPSKQRVIGYALGTLSKDATNKVQETKEEKGLEVVYTLKNDNRNLELKFSSPCL